MSDTTYPDFRCEGCKVARDFREWCDTCFDKMREALKECDLYPFDEKRWRASNPRRRNAAPVCDSDEYTAFTFFMEEQERIKPPRNFWNLPDHMDEVWQRDAQAYVKKAIARGVLPSLKAGEIACVDCGAVATLYEHRSYSRPLDVEPTCRGCNFKRGTAHWPSAADFEFKRITK